MCVYDGVAAKSGNSLLHLTAFPPEIASAGSAEFRDFDNDCNAEAVLLRLGLTERFLLVFSFEW